MSWFGAHFVPAERAAPSTLNDCGGYSVSVQRTSVPRARTWASLSFAGSPPLAAGEDAVPLQPATTTRHVAATASRRAQIRVSIT